MKKFFSIVAVALFALSASAEVLWTENFGAEATKNEKGYWPYAGGDASKNYVYTDYSNTYDAVSSFNVSVRAKTVNDDKQTKYNGFYYAAGKPADQCYVTLEKVGLFTAADAALVFDITSDQAEVVSTSSMSLEINGEAVEMPVVSTTAKFYTVTVVVPLPDGAVNSIKLMANNLAAQIFALNFRAVTGEDIPAPQGFGHVEAGVKATKVIENGQIVIIRNGVRFNAAGARL